MPKKRETSPNSSSSLAVQVTAQQSRFHVDADDAPKSKDIFIKDLTITIGHRDLLNRTSFHLQENYKYALVGRNGEGKSSQYTMVACVSRMRF
jgi:ABC-type molybdenum transport system ATPase subunit/photorepair protein PhrA